MKGRRRCPGGGTNPRNGETRQRSEVDPLQDSCSHSGGSIPLQAQVPKTIVLIDLENRRPAAEHVAAWMGADGEAWIFYGEHEIEFLWKTYLPLGEQVSIVPIAKTGNNALDFHLVMYLGFMIANRRGSRFVVVSGDTGYDAPLEHARSMKVDVIRIADLGAPPSSDVAPPAPVKPRAAKKTAATVAVAKKAAVKKAAVKAAARRSLLGPFTRATLRAPSPWRTPRSVPQRDQSLRRGQPLQ